MKTKTYPFGQVFEQMKKDNQQWKPPVVSYFLKGQNAPYQVLVSTVLSLRTKDAVTELASRRLFLLADTPRKMLELSETQIQKAIYPVGFYRNKARSLLEISKILLTKYQGEVPKNLEQLLQLPGVGLKTASLVLSIGYDIPAICVDIHVHRICNRLGWVQTRTPDETEARLRSVLPKIFWKTINENMVTYGQNRCTPLSPHCSVCAIRSYCRQVGVSKHR